ncbi:MAG: bifunctional ornithine acetyltransferase/N-acetylglutamate synthase, partial [SAR324 cluster bacterium]|nr:bifunctional ornithine acetyltransferase/N-acetylglutamate synthase [SAR324 cluster bacterium]
MDYPLLRSISGFSWLGINLGIKYETLDFGVIASECECSAAGVFTRNNLPGAPVIVGRENIENGRLQAIVVNSKTANVATGKAGIEDAKNMCLWTGEALNIAPELVLPSSTGD